MNKFSFFSNNKYLFLPTKKNPKVAIAIDSINLTRNGFKLYNPFSLKAKTLKKVVQSYIYYQIVKLFTSKKNPSEFIIFLEKRLNQSLVISIYYATINDKIILQLQSTEAKILGYIKYPLNKVGVKHIKNEMEAYNILSSLKIVEPYILYNYYDNQPFLFLKELNGKIDIVKRENIDNILNKLKREPTYNLINHPRILNIKNLLIENDMQEYTPHIEKITKKSTVKYRVVYEHGDLTPWNIIQVENKYIPFDFEYFVKDGLEYFDLIKYYYQVGKLLEKKSSKSLIEYVYQQIKLEEQKELLELFLIKEILRAKEEKLSFEFEKEILNRLEKL